jgi:hypothetical protein
MKKARQILKKCLDKIDAEHDKAVAAMKDAFPIGTEVNWTHGHHQRFAEVVEHNPHNLRLKVRGATGKEYWLHVPGILDSMLET